MILSEVPQTLSTETTSVLADHYYGHDGWGGPPPFFFLIPIAIWVTVIAVVIVTRRRFRGHTGVGTLRDSFARGEIDETEYRTRLAVLKETRR
ncbi:hypothetical protein [Antrihabitans cavernicola]|uniref:SHOCT domain-containing protein n=1 Tax=Antrihabitans cavernicola TaxID=2495913 RepID=A0A5A7SCW0_9NOCA|nr:hypothetical protein [Spelaeibacter cavernicola]KAA0022041.1 hypothetical protein FOY51_16835 [Spelaeibacter cavernicola]